MSRAIDGGRVSPVVTARLWDHLVRKNYAEVSIRRLERETEQHSVANLHGALVDLERRGLARYLKNHNVFMINTTAMAATVAIRAEMYLERLAKAAQGEREEPRDEE